ncbi:DASS family sodium-coupled anion symporter [uncultured Marinococcus sp.]|uniref:SLC13 family permease n=1 Tax=uncultured Marinococcus sp. TaxID=487012 RepID=UPI0026038967|nr:DASS family sodium-coupled anion symporter [uncultured Marinococcus sp.]
MNFTKTWNHLWHWNDRVKSQLKNSVKILTFSQPEPKRADNVSESERQELENEEPNPPNEPRLYSKVQLIGLFLGPILFLLIQFVVQPETMSAEAVSMLGMIAWIATWWVTETLPIPVTSLLPIVLFPVLGIMEMEGVTASYGDPLIFLFAGSFMIALTMEKWNLHKRIALSVIAFVGTNPNTIILGFMIATGFLSMWISNTATTMMMVPISIAVAKHVSDSLKDTDIDTSPGVFPFGTALMLGTAYAATIGGFGTLIGAPANTILAATLNNLYDVQIAFANWMMFGVPLVVVLVPLVWFYLIKIAFPMKVDHIPGGREIIKEELHGLGKTQYEEKIVLTIFSLTAFAWITRSFLLENFIPGINDTIIALCGALLLFLIPSKNKKDTILDWNTALKLPWGILWLFGGGLALAAGITNSGLDSWLGEKLVAFSNAPLFVILLFIIGLITLLTEFTSNTATSTMVYPIVAAGAATLGTDPVVLMIAACMGATFAFMFPVAAPPNAIVFASGYVKMSKMASAGIWLNLICIIISCLIVLYFVPIVFGNLSVM